MGRAMAISITEGDYERIQVAFANRATLPEGHALKAQGFLTPGFSLSFVIKENVTDSDANAIVQLGGEAFTVVDSENALLTIPANGVAIPATINPARTTFPVGLGIRNATGDRVYHLSLGEDSIVVNRRRIFR